MLAAPAKDAGTSIVALAAAYGVNVSWWDVASHGYSILMGAGAAALMVGRLIVLWREIQAKRKD